MYLGTWKIKEWVWDPFDSLREGLEQNSIDHDTSVHDTSVHPYSGDDDDTLGLLKLVSV